MTEVQLANVLQLSAVGIFWLVVVSKIIPQARLDSFRQSMFAVRDELFDYAADGYISFQHPAYVLLRRQMNGFIRYGHHLTVFRMLMTLAINKTWVRPEQPEWNSEWQKSLESIESDAVRKKLEYFHHRGMILAIKRLLIGSPLLWAMTLIFAVQLAFQGATRGLVQLVKAASKKAFTGPINDRSIEEVAQGQFA